MEAGSTALPASSARPLLARLLPLPCRYTGGDATRASKLQVFSLQAGAELGGVAVIASTCGATPHPNGSLNGWSWNNEPVGGVASFDTASGADMRCEG